MPRSETYTPSPSSSPSLAPIDSSPPSSPGFSQAIRTPPASPGAKDPFAGSAKSSKRPRIYEQNRTRKATGSAAVQTPASHELEAHGRAFTRSFDEDDTTPTRVLDPFSASAKRAWRPPTYEKKSGRVLSTDSTISASSSTSYAYGTRRGSSPTPASAGTHMMLDGPDDDFILSEDERDEPKLKARRETQEELEHRLWDEAITAAIDKVNGVIDLSGTSLNRGPITHIPPSVADLEGFVVLPPTQASTSVPSSPKASPKHLATDSPSYNDNSSRPFSRATTLPAVAFNEAFFLKSKYGERLRGSPVARAASLQSVNQPSTSQIRRREIHMFLANNFISRLPVELFRVSSLTVLSLRSNALTSVPPQIVQLTSLQELNLAQNKLRWLPAEMLNMHLTKLTVAGNPWIPPPSPGSDITQSSHPLDGPEITLDRHPRRPVSDTIVHYTIPPLTELCFRVLLAPYYPPTTVSPTPRAHDKHPYPPTHSPHPVTSHQTLPISRQLTLLEAAYALPLTEDLCIGPSVLSTLRSCVPAAVAKPATTEYLAGPSKVKRNEGQRDVHSVPPDDVFGGARTTRAGTPTPGGSPATYESRDEEDPAAISTCPSPSHRGQGRVAIFVRPAEERFTWEEVIAGVRVGAEGVGGVGVPVRWRGCGRGCLAFLDPEPQVESPPALERSSQGSSSMPLPLDVRDDVEMDVDEAVVGMQEVRFEGGLADPEDFEEGF
ncbi:hypothetical protein BN946_scf184938.g21 [Trametes cinnabarina]|uniref:Uncharacterized protein n=1 Tax=Pycnoporus cinnabarinus TaxID=5643 RepID=A0A060S7A2_PYCCI|nr:hypothetical protein BN946_scf184938.g21 [Trametes cinnabarina]